MIKEDPTLPRAPLGSILLVVAAALTNTAGAVLVQRRRIGRAHAGLWEFPGGKIESGETPVGALVRELREELGVVVDANTPAPIGFATAMQVPLLVLLLYRVTHWSGTPQPIDADALQWVRPIAMAGLAMPPADRDLARMLGSA